MAPQSLGRVNVATPGTAVALATVSTPCNRIRVSVIAGLTGKMYFGTKTVNHSTLVGVIKELWPNSAGGVDDSYELSTADGDRRGHPAAPCRLVFVYSARHRKLTRTQSSR